MPDPAGQNDRPDGGGPGGGAGPSHAADGSAARVPGSAVASVVLGVAGVLTSFAVVPGAVFGIAAAVLAKRAAEQTGPDSGRPGRGYAVAGQATGGLAILLSAIFGLVFTMFVWGDYNRGHGGHRRMQNSTQLRGMHQGLVTFANSNKEHFPGLDSKGNILFDSLADTGLSGDGDTVEARFWILITNDYFTPEYAVSPSEKDPLVVEFAQQLIGQPQPPVVWDNKTRHYSYAMLSIDGQPGQPPSATNRASEWQQTLNTQAIVMSDRNTGSNATTRVNSIHTSTSGKWRGQVLWNDNHVAFEHNQYFETRYGSGSAFVYNGIGDTGLDNLFANDTDPGGNAGNDALMIHDGD